MSEGNVYDLSAIILSWSSILPQNSQSNSFVGSFDEGHSRNGDGRMDFEDTSDSNSIVDEDEFFDAMENESILSGNDGDLVQESWMTSSASVFKESHSINRGVRARKRHASSLSDVPSVSENSSPRFIFPGPTGGLGISVQKISHNLKKTLTKTCWITRVPICRVKNCPSSQGPALSERHLAALADELRKDMEHTEQSIAQNRAKLADLRKAFSERGSGANAGTMQLLRIEVERCSAELWQ